MTRRTQISQTPSIASVANPDVTAPLSLLGGLSAQQFMKKHWQKKPLLVRQAMPGFKPQALATARAPQSCPTKIGRSNFSACTNSMRSRPSDASCPVRGVSARKNVVGLKPRKAGAIT